MLIKLKKPFNFLKSLAIASINNEICCILMCTCSGITKRLAPNSWIIWQSGQKKPAAYIQSATIIMIPPQEEKKSPDGDNIEVCFVNGLFEMYKLRGK